MAPKDMPQDAVVGNKNVSNKDLMPDAGMVKLGKFPSGVCVVGTLRGTLRWKSSPGMKYSAPSIVHEASGVFRNEPSGMNRRV